MDNKHFRYVPVRYTRPVTQAPRFAYRPEDLEPLEKAIAEGWQIMDSVHVRDAQDSEHGVCVFHLQRAR